MRVSGRECRLARTGRRDCASSGCLGGARERSGCVVASSVRCGWPTAATRGVSDDDSKPSDQDRRYSGSSCGLDDPSLAEAMSTSVVPCALGCSGSRGGTPRSFCGDSAGARASSRNGPTRFFSSPVGVALRGGSTNASSNLGVATTSSNVSTTTGSTQGIQPFTPPIVVFPPPSSPTPPIPAAYPSRTPPLRRILHNSRSRGGRGLVGCYAA